MHPEVESNKPERCPKCGMQLVLKDSLKKTFNLEDKGLGELTWRNYIPLAVIIGLIFLVALAVGLRDLELGSFTFQKLISNFMAGFFLVFASFKLLDLKGFAEGYFTYDLLAQRWFGYGYIYPFIELFFGLAMVVNFVPDSILAAEFLVMSFSGFGVLIKLSKKEKFHCVCLGTFLKVPLTKVTLVEDFGMAALALLLLFVL